MSRLSEPDGLCFKGVGFRTLLECLGEECGPDASLAVHEEIRGDLRTHLQNAGFLAGAWYPVDWYRELHRAIDAVIGGGEELAERLSRLGAYKDFQGVYRALAIVLTPERALSWAPRVLRRYISRDGVVVEEFRSGYARVQWAAFPEFDKLVWADLYGGMFGILEVCGGKDVRGTRSLTHHRMLVEFYWS